MNIHRVLPPPDTLQNHLHMFDNWKIDNWLMKTKNNIQCYLSTHSAVFWNSSGRSFNWHNVAILAAQYVALKFDLRKCYSTILFYRISDSPPRWRLKLPFFGSRIVFNHTANFFLKDKFEILSIYYFEIYSLPINDLISFFISQ